VGPNVNHVRSPEGAASHSEGRSPGKEGIVVRLALKGRYQSRCVSHPGFAACQGMESTQRTLLDGPLRARNGAPAERSGRGNPVDVCATRRGCSGSHGPFDISFNLKRSVEFNEVGTSNTGPPPPNRTIIGSVPPPASLRKGTRRIGRLGTRASPFALGCRPLGAGAP
jgi:hypothetical protein